MAPAGSAGTTAPSVQASDVRVLVRNGSGVQNAAGNTSQALAGKGFVPGGAENDPRGTIDQDRDPVRHVRPGQGPAARHLRARRPAGADSTLSGTDVVLALGKNFSGLGSGATATTGAPAATPTTLSPEAACQ